MYCKYFSFTRLITKNVTPSSVSNILNATCENHLQKRWAGHSKWQNIKSTKMAMDHNKSVSFQRLSRLIALAVRQGGPDPGVNLKLKGLVEESKKINMPKSTLEKVIQKAQTATSDRPYWTVFSGPKGVVLGFEVSFANNKPSYLITKLASQTRKLKLKMEPHFTHLCNERGIIVTDPKENVDNSYEKALEDAIDIGFDELHEGDDKSLIFECCPDRIDSYSQQLMKKGYNVQSLSTELDFKEFVNLTDEEVRDIETVISNLQNQYDEVIRGSYNIMVQ